MSHIPQSITVGLSGGVDSAVSALLLKQQGYQVCAIFMKNWDEDDAENYCPAEIDLADAQKVATKLDIPLKTANFSAEYWERVFQLFIADYKRGLTPNPDILCNKEIKFRVFLDFALSDHRGAFGSDFIATGHYARIRTQHQGGKTVYQLLKGKDSSKDQSYFLHALDQSQLSKAKFPLGELEKQQVRQLARENQLDVFNKKDSTGICFIGEKNFNQFLRRFIQPQAGEIINENGVVIGQHQGLIFHTIGQRKGLGIGGCKNSNGKPWFVAKKLQANNQLLVVQGKEHPLLYQTQLQAGPIHWISGVKPEFPLKCAAKTRYRQADQPCTVYPVDDNHCRVVFQSPQFAITPGQSVVFYQGDLCLGGGVISEY